MMAKLSLFILVGSLSTCRGLTEDELKKIGLGLVDGFRFKGKSELQNCLQSNIVNMVHNLPSQAAVAEFEKKTADGMLDGLRELAGALKDFPKALKACKAEAADVEHLIAALKQFTSPDLFAFRAAEELIVNNVDILNEIEAAVADYRSKKYTDFGAQVGMALHNIIIGSEGKFAEFEALFGKTYTSIEERLARMAKFVVNLEHVHHVQMAEGGTAIYSYLTPYADLSTEEFSVRMGLKPNKPNAFDSLAIETVAAALPVSDLPASFDWREKGAVNPVKNQEQCGSCWAFATVANIEGAGFVAHKKLLSLSEQELVDCDNKTGDVGCQGGLPSDAYKDMIQSNIGLERERAYPYKARNGKCNATTSAEKAFIGNWTAISQDEDQIAAALVKYGPLAIGINASPMQWYRGGIANPWKILCNPKKLDHGVAIVGYGVGQKGKESGKKYWIIRNSWGPSWGEKGYYRIIRGTGACGVNTMVTTATDISFEGGNDQPLVV